MIDIYSTRYLMGIIETLKRARTFFTSTFFTEIDVSTSEYIDVDIVKGGRPMAPFVSPRIEGKVMQKRGYETRSYKAPYLKPKDVTVAGDLLKRFPGETIIGSGMTIMDKAMETLSKEMLNLDDMITRRIEWMCAKALLTGKTIVKGEGVEDEIDFLMAKENLITLTGNDLWSAASTAKPISRDISRWARLTATAGLKATDLIFGSEAWEYFLKTDEVIGNSTGGKSLFDLQRVYLGEISSGEQMGGVTYRGRLTAEGQIDCWTYDEWYKDDFTGAEMPMMDPKRVLLGSRQARCTQHFGAIQDLECTALVPRFPKSWVEKDPSARILLVQSAPLPVPHQIDGFVSVKVC